jgi:hypothetical protein
MIATRQQVEIVAILLAWLNHNRYKLNLYEYNIATWGLLGTDENIARWLSGHDLLRPALRNNCLQMGCRDSI